MNSRSVCNVGRALILALATAGTVNAQAIDHPQTVKVEREDRVHPLILPAAALASGAVFDVMSTTRAFERGCVEGNTMLYGQRPSHARLVRVKAATSGVAIAAMWLAHKTGHPRLAKVFGYGAGAAMTTAGVLNTANRCGGV